MTSLLEQVRAARDSANSLVGKVRQARAAAPKAVFTTPDGGQVFRSPDGRMSYKDKGYATNDPAKIDEILQGATGGEVSISSINQDALAQAPGLARGIKAVEGVPFVGSYIDEVAGAVAGEYAKNNVRILSGAMDAEKPGQSTALSLAGTVAGAVPMAMAAAPAASAVAAGTRGAQAIQAGVAGLVGGALEGGIYGTGEGDDGNRVETAQSGAVFGGMFGGGFGAAAPFVASAVKSAIGRFKGSDVATISKTLSVSPAAARVVRDALEANDLDAAYVALQRGGDDAILAEAGQGAAELLDAAANKSGRAGQITRDAVSERITGATDQFNSTLDRVLGKPTGQIEDARAVRQGTASARNDLYNAAYAQQIDYATGRGPALEKLLERVPGSAIRDAQALMKAEGVESAQIMASIADDGSVTYSRLPDVRQIDYITRALNGVADKQDGQGKLGGQTPLGRAYKNLSTGIRSTLRKEVPEYARAVDTAADAISRVKASEVGYKLLRAGTTREDVTEALRGASRAERDAMRQGVRNFIDDTLANVTEVMSDPNGDAREAMKGLKALSSRAARTKLVRLLGEKQANTLFKEMDQAKTAFELRAALHANSKTNIRGNIQGAVSDVTQPGMLEILVDGKPMEAARRVAQAVSGSSKEAQALREAGLYAEIATALTQTKGAKAQRAMRILQRAIDGQEINDAQGQFIGNVLATSGVLVGSREGTQRLSTQ